MKIIEVVLPIFGIVFIGYGVAWRGIVDQRDVAGIIRFVFYISIPMLLFDSLSTVELPAELNWRYVFSYYAMMFLVYGVGMLISRTVFKQSREEQAIFGMGASYSNMVLVGLPIISAGLGDEAILPLFVLISIHSGMQFFVTISLIESGDGSPTRGWQIVQETLKKIVTNPIIIGLILGLLANLINLSVWSPLGDIISILGRATLPCALFALGASLSRFSLGGNLNRAVLMVLLKLIVHPLLVFLLVFAVFQLDPLWQTVAVMAAGLPTGINVYIMAEKYDQNTATVSSAILISTLLAVVSQSVYLAIFAG